MRKNPITQMKLVALMLFLWTLGTPTIVSAQTTTITCAERNGSIEDLVLCQTTFTPASLGGNDAIHTLVLKDPNGVVIAGNVVEKVHIGQKLTYTLFVTTTGATACWSYLTIEDKSPPTISCPDSVDIACTVSTDLLAVPTALNPLLNAKAPSGNFLLMQ